MSEKTIEGYYASLPRVAQILDSYSVVLNRGERDGISMGDSFLIFRIGDDISDPITGKSLGRLEEVVGRMRVTHLQDRMCTVTSYVMNESRGLNLSVSALKTGGATYSGTFPVSIDATVGDYAKPI